MATYGGIIAVGVVVVALIGFAGYKVATRKKTDSAVSPKQEAPPTAADDDVRVNPCRRLGAPEDEAERGGAAHPTDEVVPRALSDDVEPVDCFDSPAANVESPPPTPGASECLPVRHASSRGGMYSPAAGASYTARSPYAATAVSNNNEWDNAVEVDSPPPSPNHYPVRAVPGAARGVAPALDHSAASVLSLDSPPAEEAEFKPRYLNTSPSFRAPRYSVELDSPPPEEPASWRGRASSPRRDTQPRALSSSRGASSRVQQLAPTRYALSLDHTSDEDDVVFQPRRMGSSPMRPGAASRHEDLYAAPTAARASSPQLHDAHTLQRIRSEHWDHWQSYSTAVAPQPSTRDLRALRSDSPVRRVPPQQSYFPETARGAAFSPRDDDDDRRW